jgi:hypothetical protein
MLYEFFSCTIVSSNVDIDNDIETKANQANKGFWIKCMFRCIMG